MFENVDGRRTDDGVTGILFAHLGALGSGELKTLSELFSGSRAWTPPPPLIKIPRFTHSNVISIHVPITAECWKSMDTVSSQYLHVNNILHMLLFHMYMLIHRT